MNKLLRWTFPVLAALGMLSCSTLAVHASPQTFQRQTAHIVTKTGTGAITLQNFANPAGSTNGTFKTDSLIVIDFITYTSTSGGAAEVWNLTITDDSGDQMWSVKQQVALTTGDNMFAQFIKGWPMWEGTIAASVFTQGNTPCSLGYKIDIAGATTAGSLTVGYHLESPVDRTR